MEQVRQNLQFTAIFLLISLIFFTLDRFRVITTLRPVVAVPLEYFQLPVLAVKTDLLSKIEFITNLAKIEEENAALSQKLAEVVAENVRLKNLEAENEALRSQIGFRGDLPKVIPGKIAGISRFLIILPENMTGIKVGSTVTFGNNFIGTVVEIGSKLVKVRIPQDPVSSIPAAVFTNAGNIYGNLVGRYGTTLVLEKVERREVVPIGSIVQTTGEEQIPPGLVLGRVTRVEPADPAPFWQIEVESLVDFSKLTTVFVVSEQ